MSPRKPERIVVNGVAHDFDPSWWEPAVERAACRIAIFGNAYSDPDGPQYEGSEADYLRELAAAVLTDALSEK